MPAAMRGLLVRQRRPVAQPLLERAAGDVLEHHVRPPVLLAVVVDLRDVRVGERCDRARLALEPGRVGVRREQLDRDEPPELEVLCAPDLGHPAAPERRCRAGSARRSRSSDMAIRYAFIVSALLTLEQAQALVLARAQVLASEQVAVRDAAGRVTSEPARALVDLPPFPSSAMDGFAVRRRRPAGAAAGRRPDRRRPAGDRARSSPARRWRISTGGVVPDGADAVLPLEYVVHRDNEIETRGRVAVGDAHPPARQRRCCAATWSSPAGSRLGPAQLGALALPASPRSPCARRPRVAILATGSELARPGEQLAPGQIYESNGLMLAAALAAAGADVESLPAVADDEAAHRQALEHGARGGRSRHVGRRLGRAARPRARDRSRARRRGGVLARRDQAGQAGVLRRAR